MSAMNVGIGVFLIAAAAAPVGATGLVPQQPGPPTTAAAEVTQCAQAQMVVDQLLAAGMTRLDAARQANSPADLRAAVDSAQGTMRDARAQLAPCGSMRAGGDPHAGHATPGQMPAGAPGMPAMAPGSPMPAPGSKPPAAPMDHSKMPMGTAPAAKPASGAKPATPAPMDHSKMPMDTPAHAAQVVDPVCGLKVDPATAPRATHQGHAYSFCSEQHQQLFQKNPAKYLPKGK